MFFLCDNFKFYTGNLDIYAGKQPDGLFKINNETASDVKQLIKPI